MSGKPADLTTTMATLCFSNIVVDPDIFLAINVYKLQTNFAPEKPAVLKWCAIPLCRLLMHIMQYKVCLNSNNALYHKVTVTC